MIDEENSKNEYGVTKEYNQLKEFEDLVKENLLLKVKELEKYIH